MNAPKSTGAELQALRNFWRHRRPRLPFVVPTVYYAAGVLACWTGPLPEAAAPTQDGVDEYVRAYHHGGGRRRAA